MAASASRTILWVSSPNGRRCCGFVVRVLRSVSWSVHSWSETIPFHGSSTICSPSSIALARTTSSSAVSSATLPISLRYIRTGSSIPIMSAESASSSSAVGSSTSAGSSLAGASTGSFVVDRRAVLADDLDADVAAPPRRPSPPGSGPSSRSSSSSSSSSTFGSTAVAARRSRVGELRLLEVGLGPAWAGQHGFDELLVEGISHGGALLVVGSRSSSGAMVVRRFMRAPARAPGRAGGRATGGSLV